MVKIIGNTTFAIPGIDRHAQPERTIESFLKCILMVTYVYCSKYLNLLNVTCPLGV
jgi:hypothetical protein